MFRFPNSQHPVHSVGVDLLQQKKLAEESAENTTPPYLTRYGHQKNIPNC